MKDNETHFAISTPTVNEMFAKVREPYTLKSQGISCDVCGRSDIYVSGLGSKKVCINCRKEKHV